jgi:hypothetical protein
MIASARESCDTTFNRSGTPMESSTGLEFPRKLVKSRWEFYVFLLLSVSSFGANYFLVQENNRLQLLVKQVKALRETPLHRALPPLRGEDFNGRSRSISKR